METQLNNGIVPLDRFNYLLGVAALAKPLGIRSSDVVGFPIYKDETEDYHLDDRLVNLGSCLGRHVLVVDEASNRGLLTGKAVDAVVERGGLAKGCVLIADEGGVQPDFVAETCPGKPPKFYWEPVTTQYRRSFKIIG